MQNNQEVKDIVKEKYGNIASKNQQGCGCGCGSSKKNIDYTIMKDDYTNLYGYIPEADLGLGCGLPTEYADIKKGDVVVDLGSGAGNDAFIARAIVGEEGRVIGIDMTNEMVARANRNKEKLGFTNVEFHLAEIENMPLTENMADVVVSNCVLNLVPNKEKAFAEIFRILKPGAHFCVSDIVIKGELPAGLKKSAEMYAGCVAGAVQYDEYLNIIKNTGFKNAEIKKTKEIILPENLLKQILTEKDIQDIKESNVGIFSITVKAEK